MWTLKRGCKGCSLFPKSTSFSVFRSSFLYLLKKKAYLPRLCKPLLQKVKARIHSWTSQFLSYAGRFKLIKSVLFGIQAYWCQIFILPKKILKEIESICRTFLWTGSDVHSRKALVAWNQICLPRAQGGWNVFNLVIWNKAAILKLLWNVANKSEKLWSEEPTSIV